MLDRIIQINYFYLILSEKVIFSEILEFILVKMFLDSLNNLLQVYNNGPQSLFTTYSLTT